MSTNTTNDSPIFGEDYAYYDNIKTPEEQGLFLELSRSHLQK